MIKNDTVELLKECNAGIKMGTDSINEVIEATSDKKLKQLLSDCMEEHQRLGSETHELLNKYHDSGKDPNPVAKSMSWLKTNIMLTIGQNDATIADLMTDGCNMGVKSLCRYLNKYEAAEEKVKDIAKKLISIEQQLTKDLQPYL